MQQKRPSELLGIANTRGDFYMKVFNGRIFDEESLSCHLYLIMIIIQIIVIIVCLKLAHKRTAAWGTIL